MVCCRSTLSSNIFSETTGPIAVRFYMVTSNWVDLDLFYNKVNFVHLGFYIWKVCRLSNISSENTGPIKVRFYIEQLCLAGTKVYIIGPGHLTKMVAMPIYGKKTFKNLSSSELCLETWHTGKGTWALQSIYKSWSRVDHDPFYNKVYFVHLDFTFGKIHQHIQTFSHQKPLDWIVRFYMEHLCLGGTKIYIICPGYMAEMATI